jgi:diaminohydroxyphosphoribosylaminopyrimidine deaminase/5-amino-6-(5-phosphoribosylamino)uracil reductase
MNPEDFLAQALSLARSVPKSTLPNPPVGAVLVRDGRVLATGAHQGPGNPHAEIVALEQAAEKGESVRGATLYTTLEPCCHSSPGKRTPPCVPRLIREGIAEVWIGCADPNPEVAGRGATELEKAGVKVHWAPEPAQAEDLIREFRVGILEQRSWVHLKWAQTLDGRAAASDGSSRWITGKAARVEAHRLRAKYQAVLVGAGTLRQDDPSLTVRHLEGEQPARLILAGNRALPENSRVFHDEWADKTWVITPPGSPVRDQAARLVKDRCLEGSLLNVEELSRTLYQSGFGSVLVEGGPTVLGAFFGAGLWDAASIFVAPKMLGQGLTVPFWSGVKKIAEARCLRLVRSQSLGEDLLLELEPLPQTIEENLCLPV